MKTFRILIFLSIFLCTKIFTDAATIDKTFNSDANEEAETVVSGAATTLLARTLEKSLNNKTRYSMTEPRNITAKDVKSQRRKRDVVTDDGPLAGFAIYDALSEDGKSLRRESHVTKKHGKRRRHRRCKKRFGCSRSANRNNNNRKKKHHGRKKKKEFEDIKIIIPFETRKWFQYQSHSNRNLQTQVLVGNRPLALFRQQLAAAAAADAIKSSTAAVTDRSIYSSSKKIDDFHIDTTFLHPHTSTTPKSSIKHKNKKKNLRDKSGRKNDRKTKKKNEKLDSDKNAAKVLPDVSSVTNVTESPRNSSVIEDSHPTEIINYEQQEIVVKRVPRTKSIDAK